MPMIRVRQADLAAAGALAGAVALIDLPATLRAVALMLFIVIGPGAAVLTWIRIPRRALLATVPVLGVAITTLVTIIAMWSYRWSGPDILWTQVVAVGASSATWYYRTRSTLLAATQTWHWRTLTRAGGTSLVRRYLSLALSGSAVLLWGLALPGLPGLDASYYGLLFSGTGPVLAACIALCGWALLVAVRNRQLPAAAIAVGAAVVVSRVTTFVATEVPLYDWTYKHLAVVDYILVHGRLAPDGTDIYAQWSAFFVVWAWFCDVTGFPAVSVAHVFAPFVHVLIALTAYTGARVIGRSRRTAVTAAFVIEIANWVGQDYFSPQAWSLVLAYGMLVLLMASRHSPACGVLSIVVFAAMVPTHQLTPFWAVAVAGALCLLKRARPWWIAVAMAVIVVSYLLLNLEAVLPYGLLSGGSPISNAASNVLTSGLPAKDFTSAVVRTLSVVVLLTAVGCAIWRWRRKRPVLVLAILAFSPFGLLFGQSYGGEAIFRVYLYSLLGCALLIAPAVVDAMDGFPRTTKRAGRIANRAAATVGLTAVAVAGLHGYVALWPLVYETRAQVELMDRITDGADVRTRLVMLRLGGMPTRLNAGYAEVTLHNPYFDQTIGYDLWDGLDPRLPELKAAFPTALDIKTLDDYAQYDAFRAYVLFSPQSNRAVRYYGDFRPEAIDTIQQALRKSPNWTVFHEDGEILVFRTAHEWDVAPQLTAQR
ncbi:hypothetical protein KXD98_11935 [Mycobacterium sp. SMC-4]|nr:hypothetical protein KXD98_11935 [Mycobacterium sp. SMC-4]